MINATEFSRLLAENYGMTYKDAAIVCECFFEQLADLLYVKKEDVVINGFGSFRNKMIPDKRVIHPSTKEEMVIPAHLEIKFKESEAARKKAEEQLKIFPDPVQIID